MSESLVLRPIQTGVIAAVAACSVPGLPVKFLGRAFDPPNDGKWLELVHIPNNRTNDAWGQERTYRGFVRLILHWPIIDSGVYVPHDLVSEIAGYFSKSRVLWNGSDAIKITENPLSDGNLTSDRETLFIYTIEYQLFKP